MNKKIILLSFILGLNLSFAQQKYIVVNKDSISVSDFDKLYKQNIDNEGLDKAIDSYINFKLISLNAKKNKVDTTFYYKSNLEKYVHNYSLPYLESDKLKENLSKDIYNNIVTKKQIELYFLPYQNPFDLKEVNNVKKEIKKIYDLVSSGEESNKLTDFKNKNKIEPFWVEPFTFPVDLEKVINLTKVNQLSSVMDNENGSYFIKVIAERKLTDLPEYNQIKEQLVNRISESPYNQILREDLIKRAKNKINFKEDEIALKNALNGIKKELFNQNNEFSFKGNQIIWSTDYYNFTQQDLISELKKIVLKNNLKNNSDFSKFTNYSIPFIKNNFISKSYGDNILKIEKDLNNQIELIKETLLVNYFIEKYIYQKANEDSIAKQDYFNQNKEKYKWPKRYDLTIYRYFDKNDEEQLYKLIKNNKTIEEITSFFSKDKDSPSVIATIGKLSVNNPDLPKDFNEKKKIQKGKYLTNNAFYVINDILNPSYMSIKEAGNTLEEAYKSYYYEKELKRMRDQALIHIPKEF